MLEKHESIVATYTLKNKNQALSAALKHSKAQQPLTP